jgi:hypothetical protein
MWKTKSKTDTTVRILGYDYYCKSNTLQETTLRRPRTGRMLSSSFSGSGVLADRGVTARVRIPVADLVALRANIPEFRVNTEANIVILYESTIERVTLSTAVVRMRHVQYEIAHQLLPRHPPSPVIIVIIASRRGAGRRHRRLLALARCACGLRLSSR